MQIYTNQTQLPLMAAVFLATDHYDHNNSTISATSLLKPTRQLILADRVSTEDSVTDLISQVPNRLGTAVHDGFENAWVNNYAQAMKDLGYPQKVIDKIVVNPSEDKELSPDCLPVYIENRYHKTLSIDGEEYLIGGKPDFIIEGTVNDIKNTSTYTYTSGNKIEDYRLQGSIYRWLRPDLITGDQIKITYVFSDWMRARANQSDSKYPANKMMSVDINLLSLQETEAFIIKKLSDYLALINAPQESLPLCTDKELWRSEPVFKYYKNPKSRSRSTKNFDNKVDAYKRMSDDGNVGIVVEVGGDVKACLYCPAYSVCEQKDVYLQDGSLKLN